MFYGDFAVRRHSPQFQVTQCIHKLISMELVGLGLGFHYTEGCFVATHDMGGEYKLQVLCGEWPPLEFACGFECKKDEDRGINGRKAGMDDFIGCTKDDVRMLMIIGATIDSRGFVSPDMMGKLKVLQTRLCA